MYSLTQTPKVEARRSHPTASHRPSHDFDLISPATDGTHTMGSDGVPSSTADMSYPTNLYPGGLGPSPTLGQYGDLNQLLTFDGNVNFPYVIHPDRTPSAVAGLGPPMTSNYDSLFSSFEPLAFTEPVVPAGPTLVNNLSANEWERLLDGNFEGGPADPEAMRKQLSDALFHLASSLNP